MDGIKITQKAEIASKEWAKGKSLNDGNYCWFDAFEDGYYEAYDGIKNDANYLQALVDIQTIEYLEQINIPNGKYNGYTKQFYIERIKEYLELLGK